jgi:hypothetical protein
MASSQETIHNSSEPRKRCEYCGSSAEELEFGTEINVHVPGPTRIDEPGVLVFPKLIACLDCGFARLFLRKDELQLIKERLATRSLKHSGTWSDT